MNLDWQFTDRWLMGEAWTGSQIDTHVSELCDRIGPRWSSADGERQAVHYICQQMAAYGLDNPDLEEFKLQTWALHSASAVLLPNGEPIDILPFNRCPSLAVDATLVNVGYGTEYEIEVARPILSGSAAVISLGSEPFSTPVPLPYRVQSLAAAGAVAVVVVEGKDGRRMEYHNVGDWRDVGPDVHPVPTVATSREDGSRLRRLAGEQTVIRLNVQARLYDAISYNTSSELSGEVWPDEHLLLGAHHDTVYGSPGGNDNASGTVAVMETARALARLRAEHGIAPGRTIRFVTYGAEEQNLQGSAAYVARHYGPEPPPRLAINLDELSTGYVKGVVLAFPHLRSLLQQEMNAMGDDLRCHVMAQLDTSSDHFPFIRAGIDAAHLWRWRFRGRHADSDFHHEVGDTADKVNVRELKEYAGQLARLLLRLSHLPPAQWPHNPVTQQSVQQRLEEERGQVIRVF